MSTEKLWNFTLQEEMVLSESTIPNLLSGPVNIKWGERATASVAAICYSTTLQSCTVHIEVHVIMMIKTL